MVKVDCDQCKLKTEHYVVEYRGENLLFRCMKCRKVTGNQAIENKLLHDLEAFLFDLDDTLVQTTYVNDCSLDAAMKVLDDNEIKLNRSREEVRSGLLKIKIKHGIDFQAAAPELEQLLGIRDRGIIVMLSHAYDKAEDDNVRLFPGAGELLDLLTQQGKRIGMITSGDSYRQRMKLNLTGMNRLLKRQENHIILISGESAGGHEKPDPAVYKRSLEELKIREPHLCAFIGDKLDTDIAGANRSGLVSIRVRQGRNATTEPQGTDEIPLFDFPNLVELRSRLEIAFHHGAPT